MKGYNLEENFSDFLKRLGLNEKKMDKIQFRVMKKAYFGGLLSMFHLITTELADKPDDFVRVQLEKLQQQIHEYWKDQKKVKKKKK